MTSNINYLATNKFKFNIQKVPNFSYFVQSVNLPSLNISETSYETPFSNQWLQGDKIQFEPIDVTFLVDENMTSWLEIFNWIRSYGFDKSYEQYKPDSKVDATLTILTNKSNPNLSVTFEDIWPISLSEIAFATNVQDIEEAIATVSFRYRNYEIKPVK